MKLNSGRIRQIANLVAIVVAFLVNTVANLIPLGGLSIGEISERFFSNVLITPASYAFAIWGLIYLGLFSFGIYQVLPQQQQHAGLQRMGYFLVIASLAQIAWIFLFQYWLFEWSLLAMLGILIPLIMAYMQLGVGNQRVSRKEKWLLHIPISIYLGWISVATIVNVAIALYYIGWNGGGISPEAWTVIMIVVAGIVAGCLRWRRTDNAYPLVTVWALVAIAIRHADRLLIAGSAITVALTLIILITLLRFQQRGSKTNPLLSSEED